jgi:hypothetical protein
VIPAALPSRGNCKTVSRKQALETGADIRVERLHSVNSLAADGLFVFVRFSDDRRVVVVLVVAVVLGSIIIVLVIVGSRGGIVSPQMTMRFQSANQLESFSGMRGVMSASPVATH